MKKEIIRLLEAADDPENCEYPKDFNRYALDEGFLLEEPYTGCNKELKDISSWWERYFDYI